MFYRTSPLGWTVDITNDGNLSNVYINERGRIVLAGLSSSYFICYYIVVIGRMREGEACPEVRYIGLHGRQETLDYLDSFRGWNSLMCRTSCDKNHLMEIYDALYNFKDNERPGYHSGGQFSFIPGSVSLRTVHLSVPVDSLMVVGKIPLELMEWDVEWREDNKRCSAPFPMHSGSFTIHHLPVMRGHYLLISPPDLRKEGHAKLRRMMYSTFAQASRLLLCSSQNMRGIDRRMHMKHIEVCQHVCWNVWITSCYDPFQLSDTFMADSEHTFALSLTIHEPRLDSQSGEISGLDIHWFCDSNESHLSNEISVEEVEALFGIKVTCSPEVWVYSLPKKPFLTIVDINTMCGFDPALEGEDICEYFDLPRMEIVEDPVLAYFPQPIHHHNWSKCTSS
ncbi:hypothetical protein EDD85DRAFT_589940 [Armillaria nabsnona]|nr:hypothetical protein EDD85DRAFT_589940 [Armillaria nabsnona]